MKLEHIVRPDAMNTRIWTNTERELSDVLYMEQQTRY